MTLLIGAIGTTPAIPVVFAFDTGVGTEHCRAANEGIGTMRVLFALAYIVVSAEVGEALGIEVTGGSLNKSWFAQFHVTVESGSTMGVLFAFHTHIGTKEGSATD